MITYERPSYFDAMEWMGAMAGMAAMGAGMSDVTSFGTTEDISTVIVQVPPNELRP